MVAARSPLVRDVVKSGSRHSSGQVQVKRELTNTDKSGYFYVTVLELYTRSEHTNMIHSSETHKSVEQLR